MDLVALASVVNNGRHKYYNLVVDQSVKWTKYVTGEGLNKELEHFSRRETEDEFKQRVALTIHTSKSISNKVANPFQKSYRASGIRRVVNGPSDISESVTGLKDKIENFSGTRSLTEVLEEMYLRLNMTAPESYILMGVGEFDATVEEPQPYLQEIPVENVLDYQYDNGVLTCLTFQQLISIEINGQMETVFMFIQISNESIVWLTPVDKKEYNNYKQYTDLDEETELFYSKELDRLYRVTTSENTLGYVPAKKPGYILSVLTKGQTTESIIEVSMPYYEKLLSRNSESDISQRLHSFPQKLGYYPSCTECNMGEAVNGGECKTCHGTGYVQPIHGSGQDFVGIPMPKRVEDMVDITKLVAYISTDIKTLEYQDEVIKRLEEQIFECIFNNDIFSKVSVEQTATEVNSKKDNVNDTLYPFFKGFVEMWVFFVNTLARYNYTEEVADQLVIDYIFSADFKLESVDQLVAKRNAYLQSGAPAFLINQMDLVIAEKTFEDKPVALEQFKIITRLNPFAGESQAAINAKISSQFTDENDVYLYSNLNRIIQDIETKNPAWHTLPFAEIAALVAEIVRSGRRLDITAG